MTKDNILFAIIGLLLGVIIGFVAANRLNQTAPAPVVSDANAPPVNPNLPPDHPPFIPNDSGTQPAPDPQMTAAIEKADQNPDDFEAQMTAGDLYYQNQRFDDAAEFYERAVKLRPADTEPLVKLGNSLFDTEKYEQAEKWYQRALLKNPNDINVRTDYGLTFFLRTPRQIDRAITEYKISLGIEPNHELTLQNLAVAYREKKDFGNLRKTLEALKKVNPNNPSIKNLEESAAAAQTN